MNLRQKIIICNIITVLIAIVGSTVLIVSNMSTVRDRVEQNGNATGSHIEEMASDSLSQELTQHTIDTATNYAKIFDEELVAFGQDVLVLAGAATEVFSNKDNYQNVNLPEPDKALDGDLSVQFLHSESVDMNSPETIRQRGLLGNLTQVIVQIPDTNEHVVSSYVATKDGLMIQADYISGSKFDENGNVLPYEAKERPWYKGASENMDVYYTPVSADAHGTGVGIMCGIPFYQNGEFAGVAGSGMYLHKMKDTIDSLSIGENGHACVLNDRGEVIFSSVPDGILSENDGSAGSVLDAGNDDLSNLILDAVNLGSAFNMVEIDGNNEYIAASVMPTVNWVFLALVPESEYTAPVDSLKNVINENARLLVVSTNDALNSTRISILVFGLIVFILCIIFSIYIGRTISNPLGVLTKKITEIDGDNLDFHWEMDTKDETTVLGRAFENMTVKMKEYIVNLTAVTAEKERIGAELNVATQIQEDMLPRIFPAFPDIDEVDLYASMNPAKEVGGDFYDFFRIDDKHIGLVIADVSGKGVPAALFMVISKTLVKNQSLIGNKKPSEILYEVNNQLCEGNEASLFCTCWIGIFNVETGHMACSSAGHEFPAIKSEDGKFELFKDPHGVPLAAMEDMPFTDYEITLKPGQTLFVYTDGVPEATSNSNELYGEERMINALNIEPDATPEQLLINVRADIDKFVGEAEQFDDITMLCMHYK